MKLLRMSPLLIGAAFCPGWACAAAAQSIFVEDFASNPAASTVSVRSQGRKGLRILMGYSGAGPGFPINAAGASVTLTVNGANHNCNFNVITPVNESDCGFVATRFDNTALHPSADAVEIFFRGDFPAGASITETLSGVKAADGTVQADPGTVSFSADNGGVRTTASIELAYDISGSMSLPIAATTDASAKRRIDALKDAANELYLLLNAHAVVGDKVGQLFFSTDVSPGGGVLVPANDTTQISALQNNLAVQQPTNSTAIGKALLAGQTGLAGDSNTQQYLFVFSDGEQNEPPLVDYPVPPAGPITVGGAPIPAKVKVCTITMGTQTASGYSLQDQMSVVGCPHQHSLFVNADDPTFAQADLDSYFTQEIITALGGDKLEIVKDATGSLASGTVTETFHANTLDQTMSILLSWNTGRQIRPSLTLIAPDGTVVDLTGRVTFTTNIALVSLHFPLTQSGATVNPKGIWKLGIQGSTAVASLGPLNYHLLVVNDNGSLNTDASLDVQDPGTGEPIPIKVTVKDGTTDVSGATVSAVLLGPANGLGDILAKAADPSGTPPPTGDILGSAAQGKLQLLLSDPAFIALLKNQSLPIVPLSDAGHPGTYTGTFTQALKEGHYQFFINISGTTAANGDFDRARKLTVFVRPKPDPGKTDFVVVSRVTQANGTVLVHLKATPRDRFGSFLGPDYLPNLSITCTPCTVSVLIGDDLHGSYDVTYQLASASVNPTVGLVIMGQTVFHSPLSNLPGSGTGYGNGRFALSFHIGGTFGTGGTLTGTSSSVSVGGDFEYRLPHGLSLETYLGYDRFTANIGDEHIVNLTERLRYTYGVARLRPFVFFGLGGYFADGVVESNSGGLNTGGGLQYWVKPHLAVEGAYTFHDDFSLGNGNARYSTGTLGLRWVF